MACHPLIREVQRRLGAGDFGTPQQVHADLGFVVAQSASARMREPDLGAGALLDMGIYPLTFARLMLGPFARVAATAELAASGIDLDVAIAVTYQDGAVAALTTSMTCDSPRTATIATDEGLPRPARPPSTTRRTSSWTPCAAVTPVRLESPATRSSAPVYGNEAADVQRVPARRADREPDGAACPDPRRC